MAYSSVELIDFIKENREDSWVKLAREYTKILYRHTFNNKITEYLTKISGLENSDQISLRQKHYISNKHIISSLQRRADNIWMARGGHFSHDIGSDENQKQFLSILSEISQGNSINDYLKELWFEGLRSDPCGGSFVTIKDGIPEEVHQVSIKQIKYIERYGNGCKAILFEPEITETIQPNKNNGREYVKVERFLYIDEEKIIVIKRKDGRVTKEEERKNIFGFVPFVFNSSVRGVPNIKKDTEDFIFLSPLNNEVQLLDAYLLKNSVKQIHEFLHAYPIFWKYVHQCKECRGFGSVNHETCSHCGGSGVLMSKKDVSNVEFVFVPEEGEPDITPPAGYVTPPIEIIESMRTELNDLWSQITFSHWGIVDIVNNPQNPVDKTATQIITDLQPVINRLNYYTDEVQKHHNSLLNIILKIIYPGTFKDKNVFYAYGRGYVIETADIAMERYIKAKDKSVSQEVLNNYLVNYYASAFRTDNVSFERAVKMMKVEPFVHYSNTLVQGFNVTEEDKKAKIYYNEWKMSVDILTIDSSEPEKLRELLYSYVESKKIENATTSE